MNQSRFLALLAVLLFASCKTKEKSTDANDSGYFPVVSYLQSQVRHVDTSLYSITKISKAHGGVDTVYLRQEDFKAAAQDFLDVPDISSNSLKKKYTETKLYDPDLKKVVITYEPKDKTDFNQITREDVIIEPGTATADQVQTIYIETLVNHADSIVQKKMTWNVAGGFQIVTLIDKKGQPQEVQTTDVSWAGGR